MKKVSFAFAVLIALAACTNKQGTAPASEGNVENIAYPSTPLLGLTSVMQRIFWSGVVFGCSTTIR